MFFTFLWRLKAVIDDIILIRMKGLYTDINISYLVYSNLSSLVCNIIKEIILKNPAVAFVARAGFNIPNVQVILISEYVKTSNL